MTFSYIKVAAAATLFMGPASSHMVMNRPVPFNPEKASTFPLDVPGGRFPWPCQGMTTVAHRTVVTAGDTTLVNFTGAAAHGGGSCQFGINFHSGGNNGVPYMSNPADWKTIYTIIGGCPAQTAGNLEDPLHYRGLDPNGRPDAVHCGDDKGVDCIRQFQIPIPKDTPNGNATFAWIWYNRITANEVYMTCAPITVVGGTEGKEKEKGEKFVQGLPQMFLANIKGFTNCSTSTTGEQGPFNIPNPGRYGVQLEVPDPKAAGTCPVAEPARFVDVKAVGKEATLKTTSTLVSTLSAVKTVSSSTTFFSPSSKLTNYTATFTTTVRPTVTVEVSSVSSKWTNYTATLTTTVRPTVTVEASLFSPNTNYTATLTATVRPTVTVHVEASPSPPSGFVTIQTVPNPASTPPISFSSAPTPSGSNPYYVPAPGSVPCEYFGQLVCIGDSAFGICNAGFAAPQMLNKEQVCRDGKVTLRGY